MESLGGAERKGDNEPDWVASGLDEPLGVTDTQPIWSETGQDFVLAGQLEVGEQFQTLTGESAILTKIHPHRGPPEMVFNLEVDGEHVYAVAGHGLLVHNDCVTLYHGSPDGIVGDGFDLGIANGMPGRSYTPKKGVYLTDDFTRAYNGYSGPGGHNFQCNDSTRNGGTNEAVRGARRR